MKQIRNTISILGALLIVAAAFLLANPQPRAESPAWSHGHRELGRVAWERDYPAAQKKSADTGTPLLVLFQEVPGCSTCVGYGTRVLSHPLIVEAAESLFIPVAVFNNHGGADREVLKAFGEPAWNNPVVRIVNHAGEALTDRIAGAYDEAALVDGMIQALQKAKRPVPTYLSLLHTELTARQHGTETGVFAMACFWTGEGALGAVPGVIATLPGWLDGHEVVEVTYDPSVIDYAELVTVAHQQRCSNAVFTRSDRQQDAAAPIVGKRAQRNDDRMRPDRDPKYYLSRTAWRHIPMTPLQAARANAAIGRREDPSPFLSPRQLALHERIRTAGAGKLPSAIEAPDLIAAWDTAQAR